MAAQSAQVTNGDPGTEAQAAFGAEIRALRRARKLTLTQVAGEAGVSVSHLSAIERGTVNASVGKIGRIAAALGVPADWFFARRPGGGPLERAHVVRRENRRCLNSLHDVSPAARDSTDWLLSSSIGGAFHVGLSEHPPLGGTLPDTLHVCEGEQHVVVLEGRLTLRLGEEKIVLDAGDSYSIPGSIPHSIHNMSAQPARTIWVNTPVIIPRDAAIGKGAMPGGSVQAASP